MYRESCPISPVAVMASTWDRAITTAAPMFQRHSRRRDVQFLHDVLDGAVAALQGVLLQLGSAPLLLAPRADGLLEAVLLPLALWHSRGQARLRDRQQRTALLRARKNEKRLTGSLEIGVQFPTQDRGL